MATQTMGIQTNQMHKFLMDSSRLAAMEIVYYSAGKGNKECMMAITYKDTRDFTKEDLQGLFRSVDWLSAEYPDRLKKALDHCETVFTAWDQDKLAGLINAIDDGELTAYVHYLCVNPAYQGQGIGKELLRRIREKYKSYLYIILIAENEPLIEYYRQNGFACMDGEYVIMLQHR